MKKTKKQLAKGLYLREKIFQRIMLLLLASTFVCGCTAYRAERLKDKSYKRWKANQSKQEDLNKEVTNLF